MSIKKLLLSLGVPKLYIFCPKRGITVRRNSNDIVYKYYIVYSTRTRFIHV